MVPWSHVYIQGKPLEQLQQELPHRFPTLDHQQVLDDVKIGGYHVLAGKGSTEFGIASATTELIRAVFHDERKCFLVLVTWMVNMEKQESLRLLLLLLVKMVLKIS